MNFCSYRKNLTFKRRYIKEVLSSFIVGGTCGLLEQIIIIMIIIIIITLLPIIRRPDYSKQLPRRRVAGKSFQVKDKKV